MNALSWLLYWADVLPSFATGIAVICGLLSALFALMSLLYITKGFGDWDDEDDFVNRFRYMPLSFIAAITLALSTNLVPGKDTFYLIAASEAGEVALQTPEAAKVRAVINKWLDEQAEPEKKAE